MTAKPKRKKRSANSYVESIQKMTKVFFDTTGNEKATTRDDTSKEWARPAGSVPTNALSDTTIETTATENPITGAVFSAIPSKNLSGAVVLGPLPAVENASFTGVSSVQESGFMYIAWSSEVMRDSNQGKIMLPLIPFFKMTL